ncbi:MAG: hypothetical protein QOK31_1189 [Solirubrobacteraceae bacterium]|nr:hypothetical protein [Solirubrobacteraceae bacterium]
MAPVLGSLQSLIERVGAYAGIAAMLGIAVLALLYFAQAREVKRLREWAGRSPERAQELEERVAAQADAARRASSAPAAAAPAARAPAVPAAAPAARPPAPLLAPAGLGAPALASATPFPALLERSSPQPAPAAPVATPASAPAGAPAPAPLPAAATAAARTAPANGRGDGPPTRAGQAPAPRPPVRPRPAPVSASARMPTAAPRRGLGGRTRAALVAGALVLVAGAVFAVTQLTGGNSSGAKRSTAGSPPAHRGRQASQGFARGKVVVAVLNGTPQAGVAHQIAGRLVRDGFQQGQVTNASDQQRSATVVAYFAGHRREAAEVARALKVRANVGLVDPTTRAIVCPQPKCTTTVVVTVGSDLH